MKILLASKSPRRQELIKMLEFPFTTVSVGEVEEIYPDDIPAEEVPAYLSRIKADAYTEPLKGDEVLVTADTIVLLDNEILGKPADADEAREMLRRLSGRKHRVITGVTVVSVNKSTTFSSSTDVYFADLTSEQIEFYINHFRPFDKAGAYGIQEWIGAVGINRIDGSFYNVMGLPVHQLYLILNDLHLTHFNAP